MIPKIFHRYWNSHTAKPKIFKSFDKHWKKNHPDWEFMDWSPTNLPELVNDVLYGQGLRYVSSGDLEVYRSNLVRYEAIRQFGGVYIDWDLDSLKPLDGLLTNIPFFASSDPQHGLLYSTIFGAIPHHSLTNRLVYGLQEHVESLDFSDGQLPTSTVDGSFYFTNKLVEFGLNKITLFDPSYFYPETAGGEIGDLDMAYTHHHWFSRRGK